jgi:energy-coupling factor transporter ATP-binding protein EcfA2
MLFAPTVADELAFGPNNLGFAKDELKKYPLGY